MPSAAARGILEPTDSLRSAFRAWPEIRALLNAANRWIFFLDFDGTLVTHRRRPADVRMPAQVRHILRRLVAHANSFVAIVSGRSVKDLRPLIAVRGLHYIGLHGAQCGGKSTILSGRVQGVLGEASREAQSRLRGISGVWIEDKGLSFAVHFRDADASSAGLAEAALADILSQYPEDLHVLNGSHVWEVLPREIPGKSAAVQKVLDEMPVGAAAVYIGDDDTDEGAFAVLRDEITVRVGSHTATRARYCVRAPADVLRLLTKMEKELS